MNQNDLNIGTKTKNADTWKSAKSYDDYMGRWSRLVASRFLAWLDIPAKRTWLDVGCGTGALTQAILSTADPESVKAIDPSETFVAYARSQTADKRASYMRGGIEDIDAGTEKFDVIVSGLVLNFMPRPLDGLGLMKRAANNEGTIAAYVWDYSGSMQLLSYFWDTVAELDRERAALHEGRRFAICEPNALTELFDGAGLDNIDVTGIEIPTVFRNFDDYWQPFTWGQGPTGSYCSSLSEQQRQALKDNLRAKLPTEADGSISLTARAWAIRGAK
jgi:SAM-dependent methyltransferase